jgi:hypothetical protein
MINTPPTEETELIQKRPLKEDIFDVLHEKIIAGTYKQGDWLRQDDIATQLGVSMTPVRGAHLPFGGAGGTTLLRGVCARSIQRMWSKPMGCGYLEAIIAEEAAKT